MNGAGIGRLERVALREVWKHEAYDFTQWLEGNVDVLNDALGITLINVEREQAAGAFSVDLVAEREGGGKVIIENQLERSNHDHLGKVITYLTMHGAQTAIWIVSEPRPEHVAAISWLNDNSSAAFYLLKVEAVRIAGSPAAPLLTVIVGPSEEKAEVAKTNIEYAERFDLREKWWTQLLAMPAAKLHAQIAPSTDGWIAKASGVRGVSFNYVVTQNESTAEVYISRGKAFEAENKSIFDQLAAHRAEIEHDFGGPLVWDRGDNKKSCRIRFKADGGYRSPEQEWADIQHRTVEAMNRLEKAMRPHISSLKVGN